MDQIEKLARDLCSADGYDPEGTETYVIQNHVTKDAREDIRCRAPPRWQSYTSKAKKIMHST